MYPEDRIVKSDLFIGYGFEAPGIVDPHITIAYYPEVDNSQFGLIYALVKDHHDAYPHPFDATVVGTDVFGKYQNAYVLKMQLPPSILEGIGFLRSSLYSRRPMFSTLYPFDPHMTVGYKLEEEVEFIWPFSITNDMKFPVSFLHIEWNRVRTSFRMAKREDEKAGDE